MMNRVVVMGGSFNPPTLAYLRLMEAALNAIDACQGIFVPTARICGKENEAASLPAGHPERIRPPGDAGKLPQV